MKPTLLPWLLTMLVYSLPLAANAAQPPSVDAILDKYVAVSGGKEAIQKITSRIIKGVMESPTMNSTNRFEVTAKAPDKQLTVIDLGENGTVQEGFDGTTAWSKNPFQGSHVITGDQLAKAKRDAHLQRVLRMKTVYPDLAYKGTQKVDGEDTHILESKPTPTSLERFFFSTKTGRIVRQESGFNTPAGEMKTALNLSDFRAVDKIEYPHLLKLNITGPGQEFAFTLRVSNIQHNLPMPDSKFTQPSE